MPPSFISRANRLAYKPSEEEQRFSTFKFPGGPTNKFDINFQTPQVIETVIIENNFEDSNISHYTGRFQLYDTDVAKGSSFSLDFKGHREIATGITDAVTRLHFIASASFEEDYLFHSIALMLAECTACNSN